MNTRVPRNLHSHEVILDWRYLEWLIDAIWKSTMEDGLKDAIRRGVDRKRDSFARTRIPVVEANFAGECWSMSWEK